MPSIESPLTASAAATTVTKPGRFTPLGAHFDGTGTNFALFSVPATSVDLCLFDDDGTEHRITLTEKDSFVWHARLEGVGPGQRYGYRVSGEWNPPAGIRCNPNKLLLDPYALAVEGIPDWGPMASGQELLDHNPDFSPSTVDSAPKMSRSVVADQSFDWSDEQRPQYSEPDTIIYEAHVKGMTQLNHHVPASERGTFKGLTHPSMLDYLTNLGVTAVELMPVQQFMNDRFVVSQGRTNYWGYMQIGFFAPHNAYAATGQRGQQVAEFKEMVKALHNAGLEVILDVVFNHTAEAGNVDGTMCFRGIDNRSYYLLDDANQNIDLTGCGNTLNIWDPSALRMVMDSLRYWVTDMHVDGFRFDLAGALAETDAKRSVSVFLDLLHQDPLLNDLKLIAEPWEPGGKRPIFPAPWSQWNDQSRDTTRDIWRALTNKRNDFFYSFVGSCNRFFKADGYTPSTAVNYVASHDGLTLADLVAYNNDGQRSWNSGLTAADDGPTDNPDILKMRARQARNLLTTIVVCQGMPMILHGDEAGRTQGGNGNAYDQDNETTWMHWDAIDTERLAFTRRLLKLRRDHPVFRRRRFFSQASPGPGDPQELAWFGPPGLPMGQWDWDAQETVTITAYLNGEGIPDPDPDGNRVVDDSFLLMFNAYWEPVPFAIPSTLAGPWTVELDTSMPGGLGSPVAHQPGDIFQLPGRSILILRRPLASP